MFQLKTAIFLVSLLIFSGRVHAFVIEPVISHCAYQDAGQYFSGSSCAATFAQGDGAAFEFSLPAPFIISGMEGWIQKLDGDPILVEENYVNMVLYAGSLDIEARGGFVPDISQILFSQNFLVVEKDQPEWTGFLNLDLDLPAGTYWLAFEEGAGGTRMTSVEELIRLQGFAAPEPSTLALLSTSLLGGIVLRRRRS